MTVTFANEPNRELVEEALKKFAVAIARNERQKASETGQNRDQEPMKEPNGA